MANYLLGQLNEDGPYYEALGRFITSYAQAEGALHELLRKITRMKDSKGRIVLKGMRLKDLAWRARQLLREANTTKKLEEVDACLTQLDLISEVRNNLVHREVTFKNGKLSVTNEQIAHSRALIEEDHYTRLELANLESDCMQIGLRLLICAHPGARKALKKATLQKLWRPWSYTRPKPNAQERKKKKARQPQGLLHPSFPE